MAIKFNTKYVFILFALACLISISSCATTKRETTSLKNSKERSDNTIVNYQKLKRPIPYSIKLEIPKNFKKAVKQGTRTWSGKPGPNYWQQESDYVMNIKVLPDKKKVVGSETITYHNNSPDELHQIWLKLLPNINKAGMPRKTMLFHGITKGFTIRSVSVNGEPLPKKDRLGPWTVGTFVTGTKLEVVPKETIKAGETIKIQIKWTLDIPRFAPSGRLGYVENEIFFLAYFYPKINVYDDVNGWFNKEFLGTAEFYNDFGSFDVSITVPEGWIVAATGSLTNAKEVLRKPIWQRLKRAYNSDKVVHVVRKEDIGHVTKSSQSGWLTWHFQADYVNDFAFGMANKSLWDATRAAVGDRDGDGTTDYTHINAIYRPNKYKWNHAAEYTAFAISYLSNYTGLSYPWPHMTAFEGTGMTYGGMEYPMMTLCSYWTSETLLQNVISHEVAHMWMPMQVSTNERRYGWMDEGFATFNEDQIKNAFYSGNKNHHIADRKKYISAAVRGNAGTIMRYSDYHYNHWQFTIASYQKPATVLTVLRAMLGKKVFMKSLHTFFKRWRYKHPYPWDLFNTFEDVSGRNLDWFWRSWYYETWVLDRGVAKVEFTADGTNIVIKDYGQIPMPATVKITLANGNTLKRKIDVSTWLDGSTKVTLHIKSDAEVTIVAIDPNHQYPDVDYSNNVWHKRS